ncbi:hypothetical protein AYJ54_32530 [Bradyrhizobium centrolobii]|uniref:Uncharacterized protein n=1 Tax=Bradyrhizobium centrolobii TaxID=1505087 RepID=A0A176Y8G0_9BRAD|nr:hypothetical protein [Bradyrhizobium centrolobii]OAE99626.1 hypothetical protein AYJ54_32530 [Bradyrhizobium centrolobii]
MSGILTIWNDCARGREATYEEWYQDEHLIERLSVSGFRVGRRYEAVVATRQFLTTYEVERPDVLASAEYRGRLAHPTERTAAIMRDGFSNMCRTVCERREIRGAIRGNVALTVALTEPDPLARLHDVAEKHPLSIELAHSEIWLATEAKKAKLSTEEALRGRDAKISGCLALEFLRHEPALRSADGIRRAHPGAEIGVYRLMCSLRKEDLV